ncbi:trans-1,2-dihydrobenzene-1,2-diol dehydrogenase-like [Culicoides brevitarsis]|uniref:trans-1,2-dihydrobenzene-1,2-diol dehydrogenase-like n=1 Tax=Culicoides brevitarsis TaxID=469753 RepID=UPI00307BD3CB
MSPLRWGIASAGKISHDFCCALSTLPADDHSVVAVAARSLASAQDFAKLHNIPTAYEGYEKLARDPNVDVVYIGAVNPAHFAIGMLMLDHGKHILCEKPLCMNEKQSKKLLDHAKSKKLFCMEGLWSRFFPAYQYVKERIANGDLGEMQEVTVNFGFDLRGIERLEKKSLGGGTILDLGVYVIQASLWGLKSTPTSIKAEGKLNSEGVDMEVKAIMEFPNGAVAKVHTSALEQLDNLATFRGTKGSIVLHQFWCAIKLVDVDGKVKEWPLPKAKLDINFFNSEGFRFEAEAVRKCLQNGLLEHPDATHEESLRIARIQDEFRKQVGVKFDEDN